VEEVILSNPEFVPAEKLAGVFYLDSDAVVEIEEEERLRRQGLIEDMKRKREESRRLQQDEELKAKEEIRMLREERRKKREEEMWQKEKLRQEKESQRHAEAAFSAQEGSAGVQPRKPYAREEVIRSEAAFAEVPAKPDAAKKQKKKPVPEKPAKTVKKGQKRILEEKIELDEIKKQIRQEDLIETAEAKEEEVKKEPVKEVKVAYQDEGGFGGIFASQLEQIVKKETEEPAKGRGKKERKAKKKAGGQ
jgi:hypothetical protein